ncbi:MAG: hypothetical protein AVDCRST_MAG54-4143, partial [uncultured Actinomycetospora sp.]
ERTAGGRSGHPAALRRRVRRGPGDGRGPRPGAAPRAEDHRPGGGGRRRRGRGRRGDGRPRAV